MIQEITAKEAVGIIDNMATAKAGLFLVQEGEKWVAIDNSTHDAWTEEFDSKEKAIAYLEGKEND